MNKLLMTACTVGLLGLASVASAEDPVKESCPRKKCKFTDPPVEVNSVPGDSKSIADTLHVWLTRLLEQARTESSAKR